jgi:hypothetical protein
VSKCKVLRNFEPCRSVSRKWLFEKIGISQKYHFSPVTKNSFRLYFAKLVWNKISLEILVLLQKDGFGYACGFYSLCLNIRLFFAFSVINRASVKKPGKFVILALFSVYLFINVAINMHYYLLFTDGR